MTCMAKKNQTCNKMFLDYYILYTIVAQKDFL